LSFRLVFYVITYIFKVIEHRITDFVILELVPDMHIIYQKRL
jgi:hypothetical protein